MDDLSALIERLEKLTGPDRGLDYEIHCRDGLEGVGMYGAHPAYTASLDIAMQLIPGDLNWLLASGRCRPSEPLYGFAFYRPDEDAPFVEAEHDNREICVLIAALKARQALAPEGEMK